jgi:hypothetical protein
LSLRLSFAKKTPRKLLFVGRKSDFICRSFSKASFFNGIFRLRENIVWRLQKFFVPLHNILFFERKPPFK